MIADMESRVLQVTIPVGKEKLAGLLYIPSGDKLEKYPSVVVFHGRGSSKNRERYQMLGKKLADTGILTLIFDFRGCGESPGKLENMTVADGYEDAVAGYLFLKSHELCDSARIGVWGGSFGGYQGALLVQEHPVKSLILAAPDIYKDEWWIETPESVRNERFSFKRAANFSKTKGIKSIRKYSNSLLVIEHEKDEEIPHSVTQAYFDNAIQAKLREIKTILSAPHALHAEPYMSQSVKIAVDWFIRTLI